VALSRAFIAAGVPSLVMSLWLPHPGSNVKLMRQFYHHYQQTADKAKSLRLAMLDTMQAYPEPRHWAGFIPIGEAD
jgi:CHAT domain-containing protein